MRRTSNAYPVLEPKRLEQRDLSLDVPSLFDPIIARRLWDALPAECRSDHFDKRTMPANYVAAVTDRLRSDGYRTSKSLNFRGLPEPMTWEIAWAINRQVELGHHIHPRGFTTAIRVIRAANSAGGKKAREAISLLQLSADEWLRECQGARLRGYLLGACHDDEARSEISKTQDLLVYPYHQGPWWRLNVWNPMLDPRVPQRDHEPQHRANANFSRLSSTWLREAAKLWLSANLSNGRYSWTTVRSRLDTLKWLQRHIDNRADDGPCLTVDPHQLRPFLREFCDLLLAHRVRSGPRQGAPLGKNQRRQIMTAIEQFYQWMYDHRDDAALTLAEPRWRQLRSEHCVLFRPEDKPRLTNQKAEDMVLEDAVISSIAERAELLARPRPDGLGDLQAFHALMLLIRTGRRVNEVLMMDFEPLLPLLRPGGSTGEGTATGVDDFVARLRYQQTKIESAQNSTIPVDAEVVSIIRAQQQYAREFMTARGNAVRDPKYLFLRVTQNRNGLHSYPMGTLHLHLVELTRRLGITDSTGRQVDINRTHRFRHTAATNLLNAGVPLHVVMRYFGHVSPEMTLHYAVTLSRTHEEEFLKYKKVTSDGRVTPVDGSDLYDLIQLDRRADRILPNGWCTLPPKQFCDKGNACLACPKFVTDATHAPELRRQAEQTQRLIATRQEAFTGRYGDPMGEDNIWLQGRRAEAESLRKILLAITDISSSQTIRGAGVADQPA
jgi:integrase